MSGTIAGLSLWIGPPKGSKLDRALTEVVKHYSAELGTPVWEPHITLLGSVLASPEEALTTITDAVKDVTPFDVPLVDIVTKDFFFQCIMAKAAENNALMSLNASLRNLYPPPNNEPFWPHLSLVYGDLELDVKTRVCNEIKSNHDWSIVGSVVHVEVIEIWRTEGPVDSWVKVGQVSLS
ncbi:RNA ligase/cyclic nucleotide phosphodiesterase [Chytriomyces sp. MP71]|nr:RNA ligase/cyclic nucleotide phosphodiesterase [Chytriomyces sp. MP71]